MELIFDSIGYKPLLDNFERAIQNGDFEEAIYLSEQIISVIELEDERKFAVEEQIRYEISKYKNQLNINVDKDQEFLYTNQVFEIDTEHTGFYFEGSLTSYDEGGNQYVGCSKVIDVSNYSKLIAFMPDKTGNNQIQVFYSESLDGAIHGGSIKNTVQNYDGEIIRVEYDIPPTANYIGFVYCTAGASDTLIFAV